MDMLELGVLSGRPLPQFKVKSSMQSLHTDTALLHFIPQQGDPLRHIMSFSVFITASLHQKVNFFHEQLPIQNLPL